MGRRVQPATMIEFKEIEYFDHTGLFFRSRDPVALGRWYQEHLGVTLTPSSYEELPWRQEAGPTAFIPFPEDTNYLGDSKQSWMVNFRVRDLRALTDAQGFSDATALLAVALFAHSLDISAALRV